MEAVVSPARILTSGCIAPWGQCRCPAAFQNCGADIRNNMPGSAMGSTGAMTALVGTAEILFVGGYGGRQVPTFFGGQCHTVDKMFYDGTKVTVRWKYPSDPPRAAQGSASVAHCFADANGSEMPDLRDAIAGREKEVRCLEEERRVAMEGARE